MKAKNERNHEYGSLYVRSLKRWGENGNIVSIMDDMIEEPTKFTLDWISELEEFLKEHGRL
ncbi:hypothetical protein [Bacillus thuringiensis]|uniref:hypothetical protein n=1 Tax=Bacillus thuringiensis TaxID=1428 RepID=UPI0030006A01